MCLGELKTAQADYRDDREVVEDEATKVMFCGKEFGLYPTGSSEAWQKPFSKEMR